MIFKVFQKDSLERLFRVISEENTVVGPALKAPGVYAFEPVHDFSQLCLDHTTGGFSPKKYFLPFHEEIASFSISNGGWDKTIDMNIKEPLVMFGLHPCDINALNKLDKVLLQASYPMPYYAAKRGNMFIIGMDCMPSPHCFCRSVGADTATHGFDMFITDLGDARYFVEILTDRAFNMLKSIRTTNPTDEDHELYKNRAALRNSSFTAQIDTTDLTKILDMEFQSEVWKYWGGKCMSCGSCSSVCPTCYCYGIEETVDLDLQAAHKIKRLHSCNAVDFARVAGGHNFRPTPDVRLKYRYYHKHRGFVEAYEESLCVGCGRCGLACLGGITVPDVLKSVRTETVPNEQ